MDPLLMADPKTLRSCEDPGAPLHRAQSELDAVKAEIQHIHRLATLGLMAAGVAHEMNNILTPVLAYAQLAQASPNDKALQEKAIEKAIRGVENATKIAQAMLGFAGAEHDSKTASVVDAVHAALECMGRDPSKDRIRLDVQVRPGASVKIGPLALQQVLLNVLLNACTAMRKRGGDLKVSAIDRSDGTTVISISDTGPGIPKDVVGRLFQPFATASIRSGSGAGSTARPPTRSAQSGSGLGLSICRRLIEDSAGTISIRTEPDEGTTVTIVLPTGKISLAKAG
jgi:signal transduction histidine kinase